jgi:hypothetical protein
MTRQFVALQIASNSSHLFVNNVQYDHQSQLVVFNIDRY